MHTYTYSYTHTNHMNSYHPPLSPPSLNGPRLTRGTVGTVGPALGLRDLGVSGRSLLIEPGAMLNGGTPMAGWICIYIYMICVDKSTNYEQLYVNNGYIYIYDESISYCIGHQQIYEYVHIYIYNQSIESFFLVINTIMVPPFNMVSTIHTMTIQRCYHGWMYRYCTLISGHQHYYA